MKRLLVVGIVVAALLSVGLNPGIAQELTPEPGPNVVKMLPEAQALGQGWHQVEVQGLDAPADTFREAAVGSYGGPRGSRIVVYAFLITESRVAIRQSWEEATSVFNDYKYRLSYGWERDEQLQNLSAPEHCAEAKRGEGEDQYWYAPVAITMCADDPDKLVIAVVMGGIDGITDYTISDWVAQVAITGTAIPKPTAAARGIVRN